jgi:hypothetical protein
MKTSLLALAVACVLAGVAAPAAAQPGMDAVVRTQLDSAVVLMRGQGFALQGAFRAGALADGGQEELRVELQAGNAYMIMGVCDVDCDDLDLLLADAAGTEVDSDYLPDDVPMVAATVSRGGAYRLTVSMASCSIEPCGYGIAIFAQRQ